MHTNFQVSVVIWGDNWQPKTDLLLVIPARRGVISALKELKLQQWSRKGYAHFRVMLTVRVCDFCGAKSFEPGAEQILDEAFQREYDKLP